MGPRLPVLSRRTFRFYIWFVAASKWTKWLSGISKWSQRFSTWLPAVIGLLFPMDGSFSTFGFQQLSTGYQLLFTCAWLTLFKNEHQLFYAWLQVVFKWTSGFFSYLVSAVYNSSCFTLGSSFS
jgi:hypothetical protein